MIMEYIALSLYSLVPAVNHTFSITLSKHAF